MAIAVSGACLHCSFGSELGSLTVQMQNRLVCGGRPVATILDNQPVVNIPTFGMCSSLANPKVAAATAAAMGALTPVPCIPVTAAPWVPDDPTVQVSGMSVLTKDSRLMCCWGGIISII